MDEKIIPTVQLGGRLWQMRIGHKVLQKFSALTRVDMSRMGEILARYDMTTLLLWCIITDQDPTVKRETVDDWLNALPLNKLQKLMGQVSEGIAANFADEEDEEEEEENTPEGSGEPDPTGAAI